MQGQSYNEYSSASNEYFNTLNRVNLLLLKEHAFNQDKVQYEEELEEINKLIDLFERKGEGHCDNAIESQWNCLQNIIKNNKKQISQLRTKLEPKETLLSQLSQLTEIRKKYEKLIDTEYQNGIQQKLSMIRGKVDDLKKKIKEINKDILSNEQEHSELIDQYSFQVKTLETYKKTNDELRMEIAELKHSRKR